MLAKTYFAILVVGSLLGYSAYGVSWELVGEPYGELDPDWSLDGQWITYCSMANGNWDIYKIPAKGGTPAPVTTDMAADREPAWSPDGTEIAYRSDRSGNWDIYVITLATAEIRQLTYHPDDDSWPDWSPDGETIVFSSLRSGKRELYTIPAQGGEVTQITDVSSWAEYPEWRPQGDYLVFTTLFDIYTVNLKGTGFNTLIASPYRECEPYWSPDGNEVVYIGQGNPKLGHNGSEVFTIPFPPGDPVQVTNDNYRDGWPCFSPNGNYIAYSTHRGSWDIWITKYSKLSVEPTSLGRLKAAYR